MPVARNVKRDVAGSLPLPAQTQGGAGTAGLSCSHCCSADQGEAFGTKQSKCMSVFERLCTVTRSQVRKRSGRGLCPRSGGQGQPLAPTRPWALPPAST